MKDIGRSDVMKLNEDESNENNNNNNNNMKVMMLGGKLGGSLL